MKRATMAAKQKHENVFDKKCSKSFKEAVLLSVIHNLLPYQISPLCCFVVVFLLCEWKTTDQILLKITYNDVLKMHCEWHLETWTSKLCLSASLSECPHGNSYNAKRFLFLGYRHFVLHV